MIQAQLKLKLPATKQRKLERWLWHLTGVYNWAVKRIESEARRGVYPSAFDLNYELAGHGPKIGLPAHTLNGVAAQAHDAWKRCFKKLAKAPRLKGCRNRLSSIPFPDPIKPPMKNYVRLPGIGALKFCKQGFPSGKIKCGRLLKRPSGWYLCLFLDTEPRVIAPKAAGQVGIDPGFKHLLTLSTGEKIEHPRELEASAKRLAQAQRGRKRRLIGRIQEKIARQRKERNHQLSRRLVAENELIVFSKDHHKAIAKKFGKSVASSSHGQLRRMLAYKSRSGGRRYLEVNPANSTRTCSACGALSGPTGWSGLAVRRWECEVCGTSHDRDVNAAVNTLLAGLGDEPRRDGAGTYGHVRLERPPCTTGEHAVLDYAA